MTEEQVTKALLSWLESHGWEIICFDFPQSGTGVALHLNAAKRTGKATGSILPDIVATKNKTALFFENKDRYVDADVLKFSRLKSGDYSDSINKLLSDTPCNYIYFGIGLPTNVSPKIGQHVSSGGLDFAVFIDLSGNAAVGFDPNHIF